MVNENNDTRELILSVVAEVSKIVSHMAGIQLGERQVSMVENRLKARMVKLNIKDFRTYLCYLKSHQEEESQALMSLMTTHHTYFFREFSHFEFLLNKGLDRLIEKAQKRGDKKIRIWSAAASRGQEAYSLAMFFKFHLLQSRSGVDFEIWGTDIDPESIKHAKNGVYKAEELKQSPAMYIGDNWIRGKGNVQEFSKIKDDIKHKCHFDTANLLDSKNYLNGKNFDVIFCRNVFIYFNQHQIKFCSEEFLKHLDADGFLFLGVSESLNGMNLKVDTAGPSIYQHPRVVQTSNREQKKQVPLFVPQKSKPFDILCVDDSKAILKLLGSILQKENGFNVKATAANGLEAIELLKNQSFDLITLDMHMPELDGIGFLEKTKNMQRPPVVVISAINRDDTSIAQKAILLGAFDYVEKPSLENIAQASNEIRSKLKMALAVSPQKKDNNELENMSCLIKKKVLIVDDSKTIRQLLIKIISEDPQLEIVAETDKPLEVESLILKHKPDVITLDIHMPDMDGITLLKRIQPKFSIPTVMISSINKEEGKLVLEALEAGAIDYIQKPQMSDLLEVSLHIRERIKVAAFAKLQRRKIDGNRNKHSYDILDQKNLIVLGASTGGTEAIKEVLQNLPQQIPPILIVQHIPPVFSAAFAKRLNEICPFEVKEAADGDEIKVNRVLVAPGGKQMGIKALKDKLIVSVTDDLPVNRHKPSVDYLFKSATNLQQTNKIAVLLTGMGSDGALMLKKLRDQKVRTIVQDKESCVVFGMPKEAIKIGAAEFILPLEKIAPKIIELSQSQFKKVSGF